MPAARYAARFSPRLLLDLIRSPIRALDEVRDTGRWTEAYVFTVACTLAAFFLTLAAQQHLLATIPGADAKNSMVASTPVAYPVATVLSVIGPPIGWIVEAAVLRLAVSVGRGTTSLPQLYALIANAGVPASIGILIVGIGVRLHDPLLYHTAVDVMLSVPITAAAFIHRTPQEAAFFGSYGIFTIWTYALVAIGLARGAKMTPLAATLALLALSLGIALARAQFV